MPKQKSIYVCSNCGAKSPKWMGQCSVCGEWNTFAEQEVLVGEKKAVAAMLASSASSAKLGEAPTQNLSRLKTGFDELDLVLGGGFVQDQVVLLSGEPGIGKSTLLLQLAAKFSSDLSVTYVSGEESLGQVARRAERLFDKRSDFAEVEFIGSVGVHSLISNIQQQKPNLVIIDSIQTMFDEGLSSLPGSLAQVKSCTSHLVSAAKSQGFILLLVGHINKDGGIAGPKVLEHLVDTVLSFEGERDGEYRVLRAVKNRFGSTGEVGLLVMAGSGLVDLNSEHNIFDSGEDAPGIARTLVVEGNRPLVLEVQALVTSTVFAYPKRVAEGLPMSRLQLICAILDKYLKVGLGDKDVYVRTTGGYRLQGTESDLAIAAAILSSIQTKPLPGSTVFVGELSLGGGVITTSKVTSKLSTVVKFGIDSVVANVKPGKSKPKVLSVSKIADIKKLLS